jgi:hypothetical protein
MGWETLIYVAVAAASSYASYATAQQQTKVANNNAEAAAEQARLNAIAQQKQIDAQAAQTANETEEARRRMALDQRRFRAAQLNEMTGQGIQLTGTPLEILANTAVQQQQELNDAAYQNDVTRRNLAFERENALSLGQVNANNALMQRQQGPSAGATLLSGAASAYGAYNSAPRASTRTNNYSIPAGYQPRSASQRPTGY